MSKKKKKKLKGAMPSELQNKHPPRILQLKYDAAQTTPENAKHWAMADGLSADASMSPEIRRTVRNRARLEVDNNSYARGMVLALADACIGTGPRLQMLSDDEDFNSLVEEEFISWAESIRLAEKLKTLRMSKIADGEAFAAIVRNPRVRHHIKIDIRPIEADRITSPHPTLTSNVDGIEYDEFGNPVVYHVAATNPDDASVWYGEFKTIPAEDMIHWYLAARPGQSRGLPEIMPALPLFAQLRRYTLAVLAAAETAADFAAVLYTDAPAQDGDVSPEPYDLVSLERRMATVMPDGWKLGQIRAEQPTTTYSEFKREVLGEIGRCMQIPINIVLGDSSKHNYASGRLDHQSFFKSINVEQSFCEQVVLFPVFEAWFGEGIRVGLFDKYRPDVIDGRRRSPFRKGNIAPLASWFWDGMEHVDPLKEAKAAVTRINGNISSLAIECARYGFDWDDVLLQQAREKKRKEELGLSTSDVIIDTETNEDEEDEELDIDEHDAPPGPGQPRRKRRPSDS